MRIWCIHCGQELDAGEELTGYEVECPLCGGSLVVPSPQETLEETHIPAQSEEFEPPTEEDAPLEVDFTPAPRGQPASKRHTALPPGATPAAASPARRAAVAAAKLMLGILLLAVTAFLIAMFSFKETPQQTWQKVLDYLKSFSQPQQLAMPAPTPAPTPEPTPEPTVTPIPTPSATPPPPAPSPTPAQDPITWLAANRDHWPREVELLKETEFPLAHNSKTTGTLKAPSGSYVNLLRIEDEFIEIGYGGGTARVRISDTDLLNRATVEMENAQNAKPGAASPKPGD